WCRGGGGGGGGGRERGARGGGGPKARDDERKEREKQMSDKNMAPPMPAGMANLEEVLLQSNDIPWREKSLAGVSEKMLWRDEKGGSSIWLVKCAARASIPEAHPRASKQFRSCREGKTG